MKTFLLAVAAIMTATFALAQSYAIKSGDTLSIEVLEDPSLNRSLLVLPDGTISFPFAGSVRASGRSPSQVQETIANGIASNFATRPNVFVTVQALRPVAPSLGVPDAGPTIDIFMMGEIASPGAKQIAPGTTLLQALATTGGFSRFAATKRILLRRTDRRTGEQTVSRINYKAIADASAIAL